MGSDDRDCKRLKEGHLRDSNNFDRMWKIIWPGAEVKWGSDTSHKLGCGVGRWVPKTSKSRSQGVQDFMIHNVGPAKHKFLVLGFFNFLFGSGERYTFQDAHVRTCILGWVLWNKKNRLGWRALFYVQVSQNHFTLEFCFTTTERKKIKLQFHCFEFHQWLIHFNRRD